MGCRFYIPPGARPARYGPDQCWHPQSEMGRCDYPCPAYLTLEDMITFRIIMAETTYRHKTSSLNEVLHGMDS